MQNNRNIITSVIAHIDHGKTTLIDSLIAQQGKISKSLAGDLRYMDTREDEQKRGITLKLSAIGLKKDKTEHLIIDTPGHVDFEFLIESSSILSDCFLIVIDIVEGITPRTYSLVKYIREDYTVLVINKMDKIESYSEALDKIEKILFFLNSMVGHPTFSWSKNNIILSSATFCYGISYKSSLELLKRDSTDLEIVTKFIFYLEKQIENKNYEKICKRFNVTKPSRKNILSTAMPLALTIFDCIEHVFTPNTYKKYLYDSSVSITLKEKLEDDQVFCYVSLGVLQKSRIFERSNLCFMTRIFQGEIKKGDILYTEQEPIKIDKLYKFDVNNLIEVESNAGSNLLCIKADIKKNTPLCSDRIINCTQVEKIHPFYKSILIPDKTKVEEYKDILRILIHTEQCLKIKINKYNEIDILSAGKVQVEKIMEDLKSCDFFVERVVDENIFCEFPRGKSEYIFENEEYKIDIQIYKNDNLQCSYIDELNNKFVVKANKFQNLIYSILEIFVLEGPVISEYIRDTTFIINFTLFYFQLDEDILYSVIKCHIKKAYLEADPSIAPFFYKLNISIQEEYLGNLYNGLQKYLNVIISEEYDEIMSFYVFSILIPHFVYDEFVEEVRICTKGTAYILSSEFGYFYDLDFSDYKAVIRKKKGLLTDEKIITNPEKQRTLKK